MTKVFRFILLKNCGDVCWIARNSHGNMPGNRLPLAVRVRCEIYLISTLCSLFKLADDLCLPLYYLVSRLKVFFNIHAKLAFGQIFYMPDGCLDHKLFAKKFIDGLCLSGGFYDDERFWHMTVKCELLTVHCFKTSS